VTTGCCTDKTVEAVLANRSKRHFILALVAATASIASACSANEVKEAAVSTAVDTFGYVCIHLPPCWFGVGAYLVTDSAIEIDRKREEEIARLEAIANCGATSAQLDLAHLLLTRDRNFEAYRWARLAERLGDREAGALRRQMDDPFATTSYALSREEAEAWVDAWTPDCRHLDCRSEPSGAGMSGQACLDGPLPSASAG
jgi:hypothetical protein